MTEHEINCAIWWLKDEVDKAEKALASARLLLVEMQRQCPHTNRSPNGQCWNCKGGWEEQTP